MQVVDAVKVHVLSMPGKCSFPHAKIQIGSIYPLNNNTTLLFYHVQQSVEAANVPLVYVLYKRNVKTNKLSAGTAG